MDLYSLASQAARSERLEKIIDRIKDLHAPMKLGGLMLCAICESDGVPVEYPCPTLEVLGEHNFGI
jgi:hypothetical protein